MMISTSILDCENRIDSVLKLNHTNTSYIHIDVMDGKFVLNTQFQNIGEIQEIQRVSKYPLDIHLMMENPISYIEQLENMNISFITIHLEIEKDLHKIIQKIHDMGYKVGISIKPGTDIEKIRNYLDEIDMVLVMSVEPGLGGQSFLNETIERVSNLKKMILEHQLSVFVEVDGGINQDTIKMLDGVDIAVVGSYIVKSDNYYQKIEELRAIDIK